MKKGRAEMPPDPAAEEQARRERRARKEREKAQARARAKRSYQRKKAAEKGGGAQTPADPPDQDAAPQEAPPADDRGPMGAMADEAAAGGDRDKEEAAAGEVLLESSEQLAQALANLQRTGLSMAIHMEKPRLARVVTAMQWADKDGKPTKQCLFGCSLAWPWIEENGLASLDDFMTPGILALVGGALLLGPAIAVGIREYKDFEQEEKDAAKKKPASSAEGGGKVIDAEFVREEAA